MSNELEEAFFAELGDVMKGGYWTHAIEMLDENPDYKNTKKGQKTKKQIYEGFLQDSRGWINKKLRKIREFEDHKNFVHSQHEIDAVDANLKYLADKITKLDPNDKEYGKFFHTYKIFVQNSRKILDDYKEKLQKIMKKEKEHMEKILEKRKKKHPEDYEKEDKPKARLFIETLEGDYHDHWVEYLPFLGTFCIRLRVVIYDPIDVLWIRPKFSPELYSKNVEWSSYVGGMDDESRHQDFDIRHGFFATYGGGHTAGFKIMKVNTHREEYVFFFVRHHDAKLEDIMDYQMTFELIEGHGTWEEEVLHHINIVLKYPEDLRPDVFKEGSIPDINDPKCPLHAKYEYNFKNYAGKKDMKRKEITFQGNMIANYQPRWIPMQKIKYSPISESLREKLKNLKIRVYPDGDVRMFYYFGTDDHRIGHLKGSITDAVFYDPIQMVTADIFRFYDDDIVAVRIWFWWIDQRINERAKGIKHEMPDFERVDFLINLKDPQKEKNMVPFIATDVHWKEFWVDTRDETKVVDLKFTNIGVDLINWNQLKMYFSHPLKGLVYKPLPAIIHELFGHELNDPANFYCVECGERMEPPQNVAALFTLMEDFDDGEIEEKKYEEATNRIKADHLTDMACPNCKALIRGDEKLQYMHLFEDFSNLKKHFNEILDNVLEKQTHGAGGVAMSAKVQNCHVPTPIGGDVSHQWCSSTVTKSLTIAELKAEEKNEEIMREDYVDHHDITDLEDLDGKIAAKLYKNGIFKLRDLINKPIDTLRNIEMSCATEAERQFYQANIQQWQEEAKLMQIKGIGPEYADLLVKNGETLEKLKTFTGNIQELHDELEIGNNLNNAVEHLPGVARLYNWIQQAKAL